MNALLGRGDARIFIDKRLGLFEDEALAIGGKSHDQIHISFTRLIDCDRLWRLIDQLVMKQIIGNVLWVGIES